MKKITFIISFLIMGCLGAQDISMIKSEIFKDSKKRSSLVYSLDDGNGGLVTIRAYYAGFAKLKGYYIQHFDENLKLLNETDYEVKKQFLKNAFIKDGELHLIEYFLDKKSKKVTFSAVSSSLSSLNFTKKQFLEISEKNQNKYFGIVVFPFFINNLSQFDNNHSGEVVMSADNKYFIINFDIKDKKQETHKIFVYNNNFEKVYEQTIKKNIKDKYFDYESIDIDDETGTVYFLGKVFENNSRKSKKKGKTNYHFEIYKVNQEGQSMISFKDQDKFVSSLKLIKTEGRLACVGFYGDQKEFRINGVSLYNLNPDNLAIEKKVFTPFSKQFLTDKYGNKEGKKERQSKKGIKNIDFKSVHMLGDGDIVINAEEFYITTHTTTSANGGMRTYSVYHFDDIMSLRITKDGALKWARNINKRQTGFANSSYTAITVNDDSYFFINCSDKIKKLSADRISFKQTKAKKSNLYYVRINNSGEIDFKKLIDDKESKVYYKVNNGNIDLNRKTAIFTGRRKKNTRILKLKI